jgi:peptidoglycan/xylan/chitin deacetylase (PgdA/CDA1 family)
LSLHHQLLTVISPFSNMVRLCGKNIGLSNQSQLRVLAYHDIPMSQKNHFSNQISWLNDNWNIITPDQFESMLLGDTPIVGDNVLITFDDGFKSNSIIAKEVLNPLEIKAVFFVISDFVDLTTNSNSRKFIAKHIMPGQNIEDIPEDLTNMGWKDLKALVKSGHTIGCHTKTHERLTDDLSDLDLVREIVSSSMKISKKLGIKVNHFAYTFGDIDSFRQEALKVAAKNFNFVYSGIRGNNAVNVSQFAIRREASTTQNTTNEYRILNNRAIDMILRGAFDNKYSKARKIIDSWCLQL